MGKDPERAAGERPGAAARRRETEPGCPISYDPGSGRGPAARRRCPGLLPLLLLVLAACEDAPQHRDASWFADPAWEDGAAVVSVYRGRWMRYGEWRDAEIRDYVIREYLDPRELTKRDRKDPSLLPVLKANRHVTFTTGTYQYRLMHSLFFDRQSARLVKGVGTSQEGCGIAFQRWDSATLSYDTYWEGEGAGTRPLAKDGPRYFADELPFVARALPDGAAIEVYPSLMNSNLRGWQARQATVRHEGRTTRVGEARFTYDADGFLLRWTVPGAQEFERVVRKRLYYWKHTAPGDEALLRK